jgi:hypothetical protein
MKWVPLCLLLCLSATAFCQSKGPLFKNYQVSYFGVSAFHPGIKASASVYELNWSRKQRKQFNVAPMLGLYYHKGNHTGLFAGTEASFRVVYKKGFSWEAYAGVAYLRTFLAGHTYEVDSDGEVSSVPLAGSNQFMPSIGIGFGKQNEQWKKVERVYGRVGGYLQYPYNTKWLPNLNIEIGVSFKTRK